MSVPAPFLLLGSLHANVNSTALTITVDENLDPKFRFPLVPFVVRIDSEQLLVTLRSGTVNPFTYTVSRGHNGTPPAPHNSPASVLAVATVSDVLIEGGDLAPGNLDGTIAQLAIDGASGVTVRNCVLFAQASGSARRFSARVPLRSTR